MLIPRDIFVSWNCKYHLLRQWATGVHSEEVGTSGESGLWIDRSCDNFLTWVDVNLSGQCLGVLFSMFVM
jgi:hypothetical protein